MSEKDKMINGEMYNPNVKELLKARLKAKSTCLQYNALPADARKEKTALLKQLFKKTGKAITIEPNFFCDYGFNIEFGENCYINHNCVILDCAPVTFGENVLIGPNCGFYSAAHPITVEERNSWIESAQPITVGDNVWFGGNVVVLPGVTIGKNSVIGAGSVVTKDIPESVVAVGNPCKVLKVIEQ